MIAAITFVIAVLILQLGPSGPDAEILRADAELKSCETSDLYDAQPLTKSAQQVPPLDTQQFLPSDMQSFVEKSQSSDIDNAQTSTSQIRAPIAKSLLQLQREMLGSQPDATQSWAPCILFAAMMSIAGILRLFSPKWARRINKPFIETVRPQSIDEKEKDVILFESADTWGRDNSLFGNLRIARDGGMSKIRDMSSDNMRLFNATLFLVILVGNIVNMVRRDLGVILGLVDGMHPDELLPHECLIAYLTPGVSFDNPELAVAYFEVAMLLYYSWDVLHRIACISVAPSDRGQRYGQWRAVSELLRDILPALKSFSAMRVLGMLAPPILVPDILSLRIQTQKQCKRARALAFLLFGLRRMVCLLFGVQAFMVKFRRAASFLTPQNQWWGMLQLLLHLNQMMGVVELVPFSHRRLFRFIFGGVDGIIDDDELRRIHIWRAAFCAKAWKLYGRRNFGIEFFALMLTFNDVDFQKLILTEEPVGS